MKYGWFLITLSVALVAQKEIPQISASKKNNLITITNKITPSMTEYHYTKTRKFSPDSFSLSVNGTPLEHGASLTLSPENPMKVQCSYSFSYGLFKKSSGKELTFKLDRNQKSSEVTFSWDNQDRILVTNAELIKEKKAR